MTGKKYTISSKKLPWCRPCPICGKIFSYSRKDLLIRATKLKRKCRSCGMKERVFTDTHRKNLSRSRAGCIITKKQKLAISKTMKLLWKNESYRKHMSIAHKQNPQKYWLGKKLSKEHRRKARLSHIKRIQTARCNGHQMHPGYNPKACEIFEQINKELGWNGQHAENGGEFYIKELGYWVDYYEPTLNLVIEYDECYHEKQKQKDKMRQKEITQYLKCNVIRIKELSSPNKILNTLRRWKNKKN